MADSGFYRDLPALPSFAAAIDTRHHVDLPDDWWVVIADIVDSTRAIADGAYKKVNTVGVACIAAIANLDRSIELPFLFGGDGATFAIPERLCAPAVIALRGAQQLAADSFGLQLRAGLIRVGELRAAGHWVRVAKLALSEQINQPFFSGCGWEEAERRIKRGDPGVQHVRPDEGAASASFEGFECRWQNVPSFRDVKLALIVVATGLDPALNQTTYTRVLARIGEIFGDPGNHHPLHAGALQLSFSPQVLSGETKVRSAGRGFLAGLGYAFRLLLQNVAGWWLFRHDLDTASVAWSRYRDDLVRHSDFRKFDGALRMLLDAGEAQIAELAAWLDAERAAGRLAWGMHRSREALITCLVESRAGKHLHFVDGSDGGYALAARQLKAQLGERRA